MFNQIFCRQYTCTQCWCIACIISIFALPAHSDFIPSLIDGEVVYEFGDFGKAPNQYPVQVGELNVISSVQVFRVGGVIHITKPARQEGNDSSGQDKGSINKTNP